MVLLMNGSARTSPEAALGGDGLVTAKVTTKIPNTAANHPAAKAQALARGLPVVSRVRAAR